MIARQNYQKVVEASNALYVLWSRDDDPKRKHLVDEQDNLRRTIVEKDLLKRICEAMWFK